MRLRAVITRASALIALIVVMFIAVSWLSVTMKASPSCVLYHSDTFRVDLSSDLSKRLAVLGIAFVPGPEVIYASNDKVDVVYAREPLYLSICSMDESTQDWLVAAAALQSVFKPLDNISLLLRPSSRWVHEAENGSLSLPVQADFRKIVAFMDCVKDNGVNACHISLE